MTQPTLLDAYCGGGGIAFGYHLAGFRVVGCDIHPQPHYPFGFIQGDAVEIIRKYGRDFSAIHGSPPCQEYSALRKLHKSKEYPDLVAVTREALLETGRPYVIENVPGAPLIDPIMLCGSMFGLQTTCGAQLRRHRLFEVPWLLDRETPACRHGHRSYNEAERQKTRQEVISVCGGVPHNPRASALQARGLKDPNRTISVVGDSPRDAAMERKKYRTITVIGATPTHTTGTNRTLRADGSQRDKIREKFTVDEARVAMGIDWLPMSRLSQAVPPAYSQWIGTRLLAYLRERGEA